MKYKQLGRTGLFVSELCLGTMTLGGNKDAGMWSSIGTVEQDEANQLFARALAGGVNFIGVKRIDQLDDNLGAADIILTAEELVRLDAVSALPPYYPGWMIEHQDAARRQASSSPQKLNVIKTL